MTSPGSPPPNPLTDVAAAAAQAGLGELRSSYGPYKTQSWKWLAVIAVVLVAGAALAATAGSWTALGVGLLFGLFGASALVAAVRRWRANREFRGARLDLFRDGVAVSTGSGLRVMRYADTAVSQHLVRHLRNGRYIHTTHEYKLRHASGAEVVLEATTGGVTGGFPSPDEWGPAIQRGVTDAYLPRAWAAVTHGQKVHFGKFWVSADQLGADNKAWPWSQVDDITVDDGLVKVRSHSKWMSLTDSGVDRIENFPAFIVLARRLAGLPPA